MKIKFHKYHALGNDFLLLESLRGVTKRRIPTLARKMCDRRAGVGADGILCLRGSRKADCRFDIYNADGSWAEKSGNGLRIVAVHLAEKRRGGLEFRIETGTSLDHARLIRKTKSGFVVRTSLGVPELLASNVPVKTRRRYVVNSPIRIGTIGIPMTCLAVGNPHAVVLVNDFDFDWQTLGSEIETASAFPRNINVEFVRILKRSKIEVAEWERGAGPTGSSGTGAGAVVVAMVLLGLADRRCEVQFEAGSLRVHWRKDNDILELTGPVEHVAEGAFDF